MSPAVSSACHHSRTDFFFEESRSSTAVARSMYLPAKARSLSLAAFLTGNSGEFGGGAIANQGGQLHASGCSLTLNIVSATSEGGGGLYQAAGSASLANCAFTVNKALSSRGGGIFVAGGSLTLANSGLQSNFAASGAGIANSGKLSVIGDNFNGNRATTVGGAIFNEHDLDAQDCAFSSNTASLSGGALSNGGTATVSDCTLLENLGLNQGGGIAVSAGQLTLVNSTISQELRPLRRGNRGKQRQTDGDQRHDCQQ